MVIMAEEEKTFSTPLNRQIYDDRRSLPSTEEASVRKNGTDTSSQKSQKDTTDGGRFTPNAHIKTMNSPRFPAFKRSGN